MRLLNREITKRLLGQGAHSCGIDGTHLWCEQHPLVVTSPCAWWMREPGADEPVKGLR